MIHIDIGNASLLAFVVFLLVEFFDKLFPEVDTRIKVAFIIIAGQATALAVAHSDWGVKTVVSGIPLENMNGVSLALVGLAVAGLAAAGNKVAVKALSRVGQGDPL